MKKSILKMTNSWKPFVNGVNEAIKAKDFRKASIRSVLKIIDPDISMWPGIHNFVKGLIIGSGFESGREALFSIPFENFIQKNRLLFANAPLQAIQSFNRLVHSLFSKKNAFLYELQEEMARKTLTKEEKILAQGKKAKANITHWIVGQQNQVPVEIPSPSQPEITTLFSSSSPLDKETQQLIEEHIPPHGMTFNQEQTWQWQKCIQQLEMHIYEYRQQIDEKIRSLSIRFSDIIEKLEELQTISYTKETVQKLLQEPETSTSAKTYFAPYLERASQVMEQADNRLLIIQEMEDKKKKLCDMLQPFLTKKDVKNQVIIALNEIAITKLPEDFSQSDDVEQQIKEYKNNVFTLSKKIHEQFKDLLLKVRELERTANFYRMLMFATRWEIIGLSFPYADLEKMVFHARSFLVQKIRENKDLLIAGTLSLTEFASNVSLALYDPDIQLLRGECTSRAFRLTDLRAAIEGELAILDRFVGLLTLSGATSSRLQKERTWLRSLYNKLLNPYAIFKDAHNPDFVHLLFRYWWNDFERFLKRKKQHKDLFLQSVEGSVRCLIRPIAKTLDTIERKGNTLSRSLYDRFCKNTQRSTPIEQLLAITEWIEKEPPSLFISFLPQLSALAQSKQEILVLRLSKIDDRIQEIRLLAQKIQTIKIHEPERIPLLLEVLSTFQFPKNTTSEYLETHISRIEKALDKLEEEIISELGLLDKRSRTENLHALEKVLLIASEKIVVVLSRIDKELSTFSQTEDLFLQKTATMLQKRAQVLLTTQIDVKNAFPYFQKVTTFIFSIKALHDSTNSHSIARILLSIPIMQNFIETISDHERVFVLEDLTRNFWDLFSVEMTKREQSAKILTSFIQKASQNQDLCIALEEIVLTLTNRTSYEIALLTFVPGDLNFFYRKP